MVGAGLATGAMQLFAPQIEFPFTLLVIVPSSMVGGAIGTFAFAAEPRNILVAFASRVRPPGPGWNIPMDLPGVDHPEPWASAHADLRTERTSQHEGYEPLPREGLLRPTICWLMGTAAIYCAMFGVGDLLLKSKLRGAGLLLGAVVLAIAVGAIIRSGENAKDQPDQHVA